MVVSYRSGFFDCCWVSKPEGMSLVEEGGRNNPAELRGLLR
jgi:hypothetical protein